MRLSQETEKRYFLPDKVILPGVGAFGDAMYNLKKYGWMKCFVK